MPLFYLPVTAIQKFATASVVRKAKLNRHTRLEKSANTATPTVPPPPEVQMCYFLNQGEVS